MSQQKKQTKQIKQIKIIEPTTTNEMKTECDKSAAQIKNIWSSNLDEAMRKIEDIIEKYPYIALVKLIIHILALSDNNNGLY